MARQFPKDREYAPFWSEGIGDTATLCRRAVYRAKQGRDDGPGRHFEGALGCSAGRGSPRRERCYVGWQQLRGTEHGGANVNDDQYQMSQCQICSANSEE